MTTTTEDVTDADFTSVDDNSATALARRDPSAAALAMPVASRHEIVAAMEAYESVKRAILKPWDLTDVGGGNHAINRSGWVKLSVAFGASSYIKTGYPIRHFDAAGDLSGAEFVIVATLPNGKTQEGWGYCSIREGRFTHTKDAWRRKSDQRNGACDGTPDCPKHYAHRGEPNWSGREKVEHDLPATAETRARNRAYSNLFGFGEVSAEEVTADAYTAPASPTSPPEPPADDMPWDETDARAAPQQARAPQNRAATPRAGGTAGDTSARSVPVSDNQRATIAKYARLLEIDEPPVRDLAHANEIIQDLTRRYREHQTQRRAGSTAAARPATPARDVPTAEQQREILDLSVRAGLPQPDFGDMTRADADAMIQQLRTLRRGAARSEPPADGPQATAEEVLELAESASLLPDATQTPYELLAATLEELSLTDRELEDLTPVERGRVATRLVSLIGEE